MRLLALVARGLGGTRKVVVVGTFVAAALSIGAGVVLAGGSSGRITLKINGPVPRGPAAIAAPGSGKVIVGHS